MAYDKAAYNLEWARRCRDNPACKERSRQSVNRKQQEYKEAGTCRDCGRPLVPGHVYCLDHLKKLRMHAWLRKCKAVEVLGGACAECGQTDVRILEFDHIRNDGKQHRKEAKLNNASSWIVNHPEEAKERIQVLCACCHALKNYERSMEVA